jgi:molybdopterin-guanine dinucleotide biosynthesis protein A
MQIEKSVNISGVILAGGENKRFGGVNKSNFVIGGSSIITRIINTISELFEEIIIVTNTPHDFSEFSNYKIAGDTFAKIGPLGGIHSAIKASSKDSVFIFAGDMPFLDKNIIMSQIRFSSASQAEAIVPRVNGYNEPLHAIYRNTVFYKLDEYLQKKSKSGVIDFLKGLNVSYLDLPASEDTKRALTNINTPSEAEKAAFFFRR